FKVLVLDVLLGLSFDLSSPVELYLTAGLVGSALLLAAIGAFQWVRSSTRPPAFILAAVVYPFFHLWILGIWLAVDAHYFWPILPIIIFLILNGVKSEPASSVKKWGMIISLLWILGLYSWQIVFALHQTYQKPIADRFPGEAFAWVRTYTPLDAYILAPQ